jgi:hypothetical protein
MGWPFISMETCKRSAGRAVWSVRRRVVEKINGSNVNASNYNVELTTGLSRVAKKYSDLEEEGAQNKKKRKKRPFWRASFVASLAFANLKK